MRDQCTMPQSPVSNSVGWITAALVRRLLVLHMAMLRKTVALLLTGRRTMGVAVRWTEAGKVKAPVVEFVALDGAGIQVRGCVRAA